MLTKTSIQKKRAAAAAILLTLTALTGCAVHLPPVPASNPADASAPESVTALLRPTLLATSRTFLSPRADDREQNAKQMDMSKMTEGAMQHDMSGMSHDGHEMERAKPTEASTETYYTCPMHAEIHEAKPGQCPICGMTLVKKSDAAEGAKP